ncbi:30S ribosomal protein S13 [Arthrobacter sp. Hiyo6]|nr:30S ribosomal protein S13 [Arthrobacter sp. Hiyo6]
MARLAGVDIPREKRLEIALTYIYGVGKTRAHETLAATGISADVRVKDLTDAQLVELRDYIEGNYKVEGDLRREVAADIRRKVEIGSYEACVTARACPYADSVRRPTHVPQGSEAYRRRQEESRPLEIAADFPPINFL